MLFQNLHDMVSCFVLTMGRVKTKHLGVFLVRVQRDPAFIWGVHSPDILIEMQWLATIVIFSLEFDTFGIESLESDNGIYLGAPKCANAKLTVKAAHKSTAICYITPRNQIPATNCYISWIIETLSHNWAA